MTLYNASIAVLLLACVLGITGVIMGLAFKGTIRQLQGAGITFAALLLGLTGGALYRASSNALQRQLDVVPATTFEIRTVERQMVITLRGSDAACLATHVKAGRARLETTDGRKIRPSDITSLTTKTPENLPRNLKAAYCDYVPPMIRLATVNN